MAGPVVDRAVVPARSQLSASPTQLIVLVAVAFGLLSGALACAAGLAAGVAHVVVEPPALEMDGMPMVHGDHRASTAESESQSMPPGSHGDHTGSSSTAGSHPGMACVVSVDLHFPETSSVSISDSSEIPLMGMSAGCPADLDPPVPRFS